MSDTFTAPIADDSPSELDVARALVPPDSADAGAEPGPYPPLAPGEEYDFSEQSESSGWIGPSPDEGETTKAAVAALAQHVLGQQSEPEWDPEPALDPLDDAFHDELAAPTENIAGHRSRQIPETEACYCSYHSLRLGQVGRGSRHGGKSATGKDEMFAHAPLPQRAMPEPG